MGISVENLNSNFKAYAINKEDRGKLPLLWKDSSNVVNNLDSKTIKVTVDLSSYTTPGEYDVDVKVTGDDLKLSYESKTKKVKIKIEEK